ncbi:MAG: NAD-glutamate dehydrogenase domain-containing protein, partial [Steroidobacteraceae bacterium]
YNGVSELDLVQRADIDLAAAALGQLAMGRVRRPGRPIVRVFNPDPARDGFASSHTVIAVITDDMPFLLDSLGIVCTQDKLAIHLIAHPVFGVVRDRRGRLADLYLDDTRPGTKAESWQFVEVDRESDPARLVALERRIRRALEDVRCATADWHLMRRMAREIAADLGKRPRGPQASETREVKALLEWMEEGHFAFLGYREYRLRRGRSRDLLQPIAKTGLGLMRPSRHRRHRSVVLKGEGREFARSKDLLIITKANSVATVHRATYLDYVGIKTFDAAGNVTGERRFIGLWTSSAYNRSPREIPVLRHKVQSVIDHFGLKPTSHDNKAVVQALETFPRDELFQASIGDLVRIIRGIVNLYERAQVRLFVRRDAFHRFYSCLVFVPRDRYNTQVQERIERLALHAFGGQAIESQVQISESVLARLHLLVRTPVKSSRPIDAAGLERQIMDSVRTWMDHLQEGLRESHDDAECSRLLHEWGNAFPAAYQEDTTTEEAIGDIDCLERLIAEPSGLRMHLYRPEGQPLHKVQFKLFRRDSPIPISDVLPTIENLGLKLISERPYEINAATGTFWIQDFELEHPRGVRIDLASDGPRFKATFANVWLGRADNDGFNRLVLAADLEWREAMVLRTYARWFGQLGLPLSQAYLENALATNAAAADRLLRLFKAKFDPELKGVQRRRAEAGQRRALERLLARVTRIDDDRILRAFLAAIDATLRTNFFQAAADGAPKPYLSIKIDPRKVPETPQPKPMFEIFVHSPQFAGVHLRLGRVARG